MFFSFACLEVNLVFFLSRYTWQAYSNDTTHVIVSMQGYLSHHKLNEIEILIYQGDGNAKEVDIGNVFQIACNKKFSLKWTFIITFFG